MTANNPEPAHCGATTDILVDHNVHTFCCDLTPNHSGDRHEGNVLLGDVPLRVAWPRDGEPSSRSSSAPPNAHGQLPSGLTLAALRERAVLFGGNGCEVPAPDLLCLLAEAREELADRDAAGDRRIEDIVTAWFTKVGYLSTERHEMVRELQTHLAAALAARDAELAKLREQMVLVRHALTAADTEAFADAKPCPEWVTQLRAVLS